MAASQPGSKTMIKPFSISIPDERLSAIRNKVACYDWDQLPDAGGWRSGIGKADLKRLTDYWLQKFDWRTVEKKLNELPHFMAEIDGEHVHFIHVRGNGSKAPIILIHGWPGSFTEFEELIFPLAADGHDVVVPSIPGFAFSNPITGIIGPRRIARIMHQLMHKLFGSLRYIAQGGDWGAHIATWMAYLEPESILGFHLNMVEIAAENAKPTTDEEKDLLDRRAKILNQEQGYSHEQQTRPQTLGVAMSDSPVGVAGWILEKFGIWADLPRRADGSPDPWSKFTEEKLLTNIMLYVAPSSFVTATWIYQGMQDEQAILFPADTYITVPLGIAAFPDPVFLPTPRSFAEKTYNVVHYNVMEAGGHFAAFEQPELLLTDFRAFIETITKA